MRKRMFESIDPHLTIAVRAMANRVALRKGIGYISIDNVEGEHVGDPNRMDKDCLISFDMSFVVYATHKNLPKLSPDRSKINLHVDIAPYEGIDAYWRDSNLVLHKSINLVDTVRADSKLTTLESCILEAMYIVLEYGERKNWGDTYSVTYSYNSTRSESYSKRVDEYNAEGREVDLIKDFAKNLLSYLEDWKLVPNPQFGPAALLHIPTNTTFYIDVDTLHRLNDKGDLRVIFSDQPDSVGSSYLCGSCYIDDISRAVRILKERATQIERWSEKHPHNSTRSESYSKRIKSKRVKVESASKGSYTLSGYLTNLGKYNEGELVGKWIDLPIDEDDFKEELEEIGVDDEGEYFWSDWDCDLPCVTDKLGEHISLDDANELAEKVEEVEDKDAFCAAVEMLGIDEALDNWKSMYNIGEEVRSFDYTIGNYYFNDVHGGDLDKKTLQNYFDYSAYGRDLRMNGNFIYYDGHVWEYLE